jgi:sugar phosphate isomerase/epimerase
MGIRPTRREFAASLAGFFAARGATWPFFALCMDTHDSKKRSLAEQAAMLSELGYDGAGHLWFDHVAERFSTLDAARLKLYQIYARLNLKPGVPEPFDRRLNEVLPLLKGRPTQLAFLVEGGRPSDESLDSRAVELLNRIASLAQPYGVRVALYPHVNNWLERVEDAIRVARKVDRPNTGVMFNLCHWMKTGDEARLQPLLEAALPKLFAVTINGSDTVAEIKAGKGNWIQPLDSGSFDMAGFLRTLKNLGYAGPVGLQCYGIPGDAREHLARSMAAWRRLTGESA